MKKHALITGGTKGIGKAIACSLGNAGYDLLLTYASDDDAARLAQENIRQATGAEVQVLKADITDMQSIDTIQSFLTKHTIRLDALIFNAGLTCRDTFEEIKPTDWERVFFGNIHFPVFLLQRILSQINKGGSVVFTGSAMGIYPHSVSLAYGVTKSAVHALVKNLVKFLAPYQIRVNGVAPGFVDTEWQKTKPAEIRKNIENKIALERFCDPAELAEVYKTLVENSYFNGEIVVVDGGYSYK
ncbi:3-oxoacyl-[acyl-carrier protein] reductase [Parabacteroides sp. PF5-5]|uniref:SDR family NAD(P)-dependent oxidoreductase n=1 Tax=unclassified Parabacteroides TaxID=2649774 RepID=UPI0024770C38|nr:MULTISPECIES: SDR family oxidoreductase [unclassified Parabacteroides]MDH6305618.1 3-oxoacyl-[acyl-carrier protein] reductase [Parabacteroides sp. PH5-39]MDH6316344.1 3-oxoacyl-[acyl-carrier protein] reductase [Parabacteroides sp. PF5-13]MDH6319827.1 3-oxoacyl-[acyl-carrier protein] reductase [Parabacteroides sp. PH5-13]MDH6323582.1 3-oxoacyl-[acyl-carrier protein] reductase [Parabacteroides sp. PH5-8]MDH6327531.1 3-oxoacyl-[acyl-carrier protein] reductase [Parabacteroides sp. PH5-41]